MPKHTITIRSGCGTIRWPENNQDLDTESGDTILEALEKARVLSIDTGTDGKTGETIFRITEACSDVFYGVLTREQLLILANELRTLADEPHITLHGCPNAETEAREKDWIELELKKSSIHRDMEKKLEEVRDYYRARGLGIQFVDLDLDPSLEKFEREVEDKF
jgi:hypothetical protein